MKKLRDPISLRDFDIDGAMEIREGCIKRLEHIVLESLPAMYVSKTGRAVPDHIL